MNRAALLVLAAILGFPIIAWLWDKFLGRLTGLGWF